MDVESFEPRPPKTIENADPRLKSPTRMRYEAEVSMLRKQNGNLEDIRRKLGLSRRKICQLLLVDPSAWTRWTAPKGDAPPHIYQALDWYISIMEKDPEYRRLASRIAGWVGREKDYEGRLTQIETLLAPKVTPDWRDFAIPFLAFFGGILLSYFIFRPL